MAQDFAKRKQGSGGKRAPARKRQAPRRSGGKQANSGGGWRWYGAGLLTGVFLSFLLYLGTLPPPGGATAEPQSGPQAVAEPPKPRFDFYTLLPEQTIDVEVDPAVEVIEPRKKPLQQSATCCRQDRFASEKMPIDAEPSCYCWAWSPRSRKPTGTMAAGTGCTLAHTTHTPKWPRPAA